MHRKMGTLCFATTSISTLCAPWSNAHNTLTCTHTHAHTLTHSHAHIHTHTHTRTHTRAHTQAHTHTPTNTHMHRTYIEKPESKRAVYCYNRPSSLFYILIKCTHSLHPHQPYTAQLHTPHVHRCTGRSVSCFATTAPPPFLKCTHNLHPHQPYTAQSHTPHIHRCTGRWVSCFATTAPHPFSTSP